MGIQNIIFGIVALATFFFAGKAFLRIRRNINFGKDELTPSGQRAERFKNTLLIALGQKKMFARPIAATLHLFIYAAFLVTQIELLEIFVDGAFGTHRFFEPFLGGFYTFIISFIEVLSVLALIATLAFIARRHIIKLARFQSPELKGSPTKDALTILIAEIFLISFIFLMNTADMAATNGQLGFLVSGWIYEFWYALDIHSGETLHVFERIGWWGHIIMVFAYLNYLPYSKHLHIIFAFPNTFFAKLSVKGELENMPDIQKEVASMLDPDAAFNSAPTETMEMPKFGAKDIFDLSWKHMLAAYTCTECGRCTSSCPANLTGKALSPRKIMMDIRDRAEEVAINIDANKTELINAEAKTLTSVLTKDNYDDGKNLFSYITEAELRACTTCNACVEACPVSISPLDIIVELRRNFILEQSKSPESWNNMFNAIDNNGAPWAFPRDDRDKWIAEAVNNQ
jgi:heterodisulfide reductase subunit C